MKSGFTLAEILITLGIIGVVAALTAPSLVQNAGNAKIGPTLQKIVSTVEVANQQLLVEKEATTLSSAVGTNLTTGTNTDWEAYVKELVNYISGSSYETGKEYYFNYYSGESYHISNKIIMHIGGTDVIINATSLNMSTLPDPKGSFKGICKGLTDIDINGNNHGPNKYGADIFAFVVDNGGKLIPMGGKEFSYIIGVNSPYWVDYCSEKKVTHGIFCSGSVFDNNLKVIYK